MAMVEQTTRAAMYEGINNLAYREHKQCDSNIFEVF